jgi:hypothetical protein
VADPRRSCLAAWHARKHRRLAATTLKDVSGFAQEWHGPRRQCFIQGLAAAAGAEPGIAAGSFPDLGRQGYCGSLSWCGACRGHSMLRLCPDRAGGLLLVLVAEGWVRGWFWWSW